MQRVSITLTYAVVAVKVNFLLIECRRSPFDLSGELYKNGFVVAELHSGEYLYRSWPLKKCNDAGAKALTDEADDRWFNRYDIPEIITDTDYIKRYLAYCRRICSEASVLLFETQWPAPRLTATESYTVAEPLGYDCIGTVYESYLQAEAPFFREKLEQNNLHLNRYGLFNNIADVQLFIDLRQQALSNGVNLEDYWKEVPARISIVHFESTDSITATVI